jgi:hypothetical protein
MKLLTKKIRKQLPKLYESQNDKDPILHVKFFTPWTSWTWYAAYAELGISCVMRSSGLCGAAHDLPVIFESGVTAVTPDSA